MFTEIIDIPNFKDKFLIRYTKYVNQGRINNLIKRLKKNANEIMNNRDIIHNYKDCDYIVNIIKDQEVKKIKDNFCLFSDGSYQQKNMRGGWGVTGCSSDFSIKLHGKVIGKSSPYEMELKATVEAFKATNKIDKKSIVIMTDSKAVVKSYRLLERNILIEKNSLWKDLIDIKLNTDKYIDMMWINRKSNCAADALSRY